MTLAGTWSIEFLDGGPQRPAPYESKTLTCWTEAPDAKARAFAGAARYTLRFKTPPTAADDWILDLGDVRQSARVRLDGRDAAVLIALPMRARVGEFLKPPGDENLLEIKVANLSANRIRDLALRQADWKIMKDINIVNVQYKKLEPEKWPLEPSGLLGPVGLIPQESKR